MLRFIRLHFALCLGLAGPAAAQTPDASGTCVRASNEFKTAFVAAKARDRLAPKYPNSAIDELGEGWVHLELKIGKDGVHQIAAIRDRLGSKAFVAAAETAIKQWRYEPATWNGQPDEHNGLPLTVVFRFPALQKPMAEHADAVEKFENARRHIRNGDVRKAIEVLEAGLAGVDGRSNMNLYEQTKFSLTAATAHWSLKDAARALPHARRALIEDGMFLDKQDAGRAWRLHRVLSIANGDYADILCDKPRPDFAAHGADLISDADLGRLEAEVRRATAEKTVLAIPAILGPTESGGVWEHRLLRNKFGFEGINGQVSDFRLVCTRLVLDGKADQTQDWEVPSTSGPCTIYVKGIAGSGFTFLEDW